MRITQNMISKNMLTNIDAKLKRLYDAHNQAATGKKFQNASDDPIGFISNMSISDSINEVNQYEDNCKDAISWMNASDSALGEFTSVLQRLEEIGVAAANGTLSQTSCDAYAKEVEEMRKYTLQIANTQYGDKYLFSGQKVDKAAYDANYVYQGSPEGLKIQAGDTSTLTYSYPGSEIFSTDGQSIFDIMAKLQSAIHEMDFSQVSGYLKNIQDTVDNVSNVQAGYGAKVNRLEMSVGRLDALSNQFTAMKSDNEDADFAAVAVDLSTQQTAYEAALASGSKIMRVSLMDYI